MVVMMTLRLLMGMMSMMRMRSLVNCMRRPMIASGLLCLMSSVLRMRRMMSSWSLRVLMFFLSMVRMVTMLDFFSCILRLRPRLSSLLRIRFLSLLNNLAICKVILNTFINRLVLHNNLSEHVVMTQNCQLPNFQVLETIVVTNDCQIRNVSCLLRAWEHFVVMTRNHGIINIL